MSDDMKFIQITKPESIMTVDSPGKHIFFLHNYSGMLDITISAEEAEVFVYGLYIGNKKESFHLNTIQRHSCKNTTSDLLIKGVFFDASKFVYEGMIRIDKGAHASNAYQKNQNVLLSPHAYVDSRPFLEINAHDVRCTHGSTTGSLSKDQILFANSRGLSPEAAQKLLLEGFISEIFSAVHNADSSEVKQIEVAMHEKLAQCTG